MQTEKALINNRLCISKVAWKFRIQTIYNFTVIYTIFLKSSLLFNSFYCLFCSKTKLYDSITQKLKQLWMQKISVLVICVEAIIYLLLYNLYDGTFKAWICKNNHQISNLDPQTYQNTIFHAKRKAAILKNYFHTWNQHTQVFQDANFIQNKKSLKLKPRLPCLGIFKLEFAGI